MVALPGRSICTSAPTIQVQIAPRLALGWCKSRCNLHFGAICTSICTISNANCTGICTIPSTNCTCHLHLLKCKLHMPFALQKADLHQQACEIAKKEDSGSNQDFKVQMASAICTWNGANDNCDLHLEWCKSKCNLHLE